MNAARTTGSIQLEMKVYPQMVWVEGNLLLEIRALDELLCRNTNLSKERKERKGFYPFSLGITRITSLTKEVAREKGQSVEQKRSSFCM